MRNFAAPAQPHNEGASTARALPQFAIALFAGLLAALVALAVGLGAAGNAGADEGDAADGGSAALTLAAHLQTYGWTEADEDGKAGVTDEDKRLEALTIELSGTQGGVTYAVYTESYGWLEAADGETAGTTGESLSIKALTVELTGEAAEEYDVWYRVWVDGYGWTGWARNGASCGTMTSGAIVQAVQVVLLEAGSAAPGNVTPAMITSSFATQEEASFEGPAEALVAYYEEVDAEDIVEYGDVHYVEGQILVVGAADATFSQIEALLAGYGGEIVGYISFTNDYQVDVSGDYDYEGLVALCEELEASELIDDATLSYVEELTYDSVDYTADPWTDSSDLTDASGSVWDEDDPDGLNWWAEAIGMVSVWEMDLDLATVKVGIIDSMFDTESADLADAFAVTWYNAENDDGSCAVADLYTTNTSESAYSHGTHVAGIIAAEAGNGTGIAGVAQNAELYAFATKTDEATSSVTSWSCWGGVFQWKYALSLMFDEGVKVVNISMGYETVLTAAAAGEEWALTWLDENSGALSEFLQKYIDAGYEFLIVKAACNTAGLDASFDVLGYITDEEVAERIIIVGNAYDSGSASAYAIAGSSNVGDRVDVYAPGANILSTMPNDETATKSGTSMASPVVAGIAALIWGVNPELSASQVRAIILASACAGGNSSADAAGDATTIVNAYTCVLLALDTDYASTTESGHSTGSFSDWLAVSTYGTAYGLVQTATSVEDASTLNILVEAYDADGALVATSDAEAAEGTGLSTIVLTDAEVPDSVAEVACWAVELPEGDYTFVATAEGYDSSEIQVSVAAGEATYRNFNLPTASEDSDDLALYASVLDELYWGLSDQWYGWDPDALQVEGIIGFFWYWNLYFEDQDTYWGYAILSLEDAVYAFVDLDGDGTSELVTGVLDDDGAFTLYNLYTIVDGTVVQLCDTGTRWIYWICADGTIACRTSYSALEISYDYYALQDGELVSTASLNSYDFENDGGWSWYTNDGTPVSSSEAETTVAAYAVEMELDYQSLADYTPSA